MSILSNLFLFLLTAKVLAIMVTSNMELQITKHPQRYCTNKGNESKLLRL